jgi:hypothetical protein
VLLIAEVILPLYVVCQELTDEAVCANFSLAVDDNVFILLVAVFILEVTPLLLSPIAVLIASPKAVASLPVSSIETPASPIVELKEVSQPLTLVAIFPSVDSLLSLEPRMFDKAVAPSLTGVKVIPAISPLKPSLKSEPVTIN